MPLAAIHHYIGALPRRQAEMRMMQAEAASVPHMSEEAHRDWADSVNRHFEAARKAEIATPSKLMGIGVRTVFVQKEIGDG